MTRPFVRHYDEIFADKNYAKDIDDFLSLSGSSAPGRTDLLEIGAGTGNQTLRLARHFNSVTASEIDADFASVLEAKVAALRPEVRVSREPLASLQPVSYDAAAAFFHVLNYMTRDILAAFARDLARCLKPGAPFVTDIWHAEAVVKSPPRHETRRKHVDGRDIVIAISPALDPLAMTVLLDYRIAVGAAEPFEESLHLHLWRRAELEACFGQAGFTDFAFWDYRAYPAALTDESWRAWFRCTKMG